MNKKEKKELIKLIKKLNIMSYGIVGQGGLNIKSITDINVVANEGDGRIKFDGEVIFTEPLGIGKDLTTGEARTDFYFIGNNLLLRFYEHGFPTAIPPDAFLINPTNESTSFQINTSKGKTFNINGTTGNSTFNGNVTMDNYAEGWNPTRINFGIPDTYIGLTKAFPVSFQFITPYDMRWSCEDMTITTDEMTFDGNSLEFTALSGGNMAFRVSHAGSWLSFKADGGDIYFNKNFGTANISFYNENVLLMRLDADTNFVNITGVVNADVFDGDGGNLTNLMMYAQLSDNADQTFAVAGNDYAVNFSTNDEIDNIAHVEGEHNITIVYDGVYQFFPQPQITAGAGDAGNFHMWYQKDVGSGYVNIPNSNIEITLDSLDEDVGTLCGVMRLDAGDRIRIMVSVSDNGIELDAQTPAGEPAIPSIILSVIGNR